MPLHLLGKKSWNVYNAVNIARVKADEEAAAAREAAHDQRMQELDAERRAAILRGQTPPPLPEEETKQDGARKRDHGGSERGHDRKKRKLAGEDDTDMDIRLAASITKPNNEEEDGKVLKLRTATSDAPLTDHAGHIDLFPVDMKEAIKREKNAEAEKEKRKKEKAFEDQYTMRFSNAAGKPGLDQPWYAARPKSTNTPGEDDASDCPGFESKNVWGNEDPLRKEREKARISTNDPFAFMQKAQMQLQRSKEDKKKLADERNRDLLELKSTQEREDRRRRHRQRDGGDDKDPMRDSRHAGDRPSKSRRRHSRSRSRSRSRDRERSRKSSHRRERVRSRSRIRSRSRSPGRERDCKDRSHRHSSSRHHRSESLDGRHRRKAGGREGHDARR